MFSIQSDQQLIEYKALLVGLKLAKELGVKRLRVFTDRLRTFTSALHHFGIYYIPRVKMLEQIPSPNSQP